MPRLRLRPAVEQALEALDLSDQECRVVRLILLGRSSSEVMNALHIKLGTLRTHKRHIFAKLGVHKESQLVAVVFARASETSEKTAAADLSVGSLDARRCLRHPEHEYVGEQHPTTQFPEDNYAWALAVMKPISTTASYGWRKTAIHQPHPHGRFSP